MNFVFLEQEYDGNRKFPYDAVDVAFYLNDLLLREEQNDTDSELLILDDEHEQESFRIDVKQS